MFEGVGYTFKKLINHMILKMQARGLMVFSPEKHLKRYKHADSPNDFFLKQPRREPE